MRIPFTKFFIIIVATMTKKQLDREIRSSIAQHEGNILSAIILYQREMVARNKPVHSLVVASRYVESVSKAS